MQVRICFLMQENMVVITSIVVMITIAIVMAFNSRIIHRSWYETIRIFNEVIITVLI